uniref:Uncharacterized protein n=1 Tax=Arundo donax TaxID=35708 RepID=A0A0A8ZPA1_ARUDO
MVAATDLERLRLNGSARGVTAFYGGATAGWRGSPPRRAATLTAARSDLHGGSAGSVFHALFFHSGRCASSPDPPAARAPRSRDGADPRRDKRVGAAPRRPSGCGCRRATRL